jgi:hypothetical protein
MGLSASLAADYRVVDDPQAVTFTSVNPGGNVALTISNAVAEVLTQKSQGFASGVFRIGDLRWLIGNDQISATNQPKPGDTITDPSGAVWCIIDDGVTIDPCSVSWECITRRAR